MRCLGSPAVMKKMGLMNFFYVELSREIVLVRSVFSASDSLMMKMTTTRLRIPD